MHDLLDRVLGREGGGCRCEATPDGRTLAVDAGDCDGRLGEAPACRATIADALRRAEVERVRIRSHGVDRIYDAAAADLLAAAGRFAALAIEEAPSLAERARSHPQDAAEAAAARAAPVDEIAADVGLLEAGAAVSDPFEPAIAPAIADARFETAPPREAVLRDARELSTGATARRYEAPGEGTPIYHLDPVETDLDDTALAVLATAYRRLAERADEPAPVQVVRDVLAEPDGAAAVADSDEAVAALEDLPVRTLAAVLRKHTRGYGVLEDCFADPAVTDVYASGPAAGNPLWVVADGEQCRTNVRLGENGVGAIASRLRRTSGRSFSRASPTIDATATIADEAVRVAGVLDPATEGHAFAFRSGGEEAFTLPGLVANGTLPAEAAGLLSVAVRRSAAGLLAGTRGAGKTTALGALLWELPAVTRTIVIEDTPELPVATLQDEGRDVQPLHTTLADGPGISPTDALRTALRLGESAIVLGEVRGEEAAVLYEAMRVGASGETVLGTIHGDGGAAVRERVVGDIGVPESSFAATDLVVTCEQYQAPGGGRARRVAAIEELVGTDPVRFEPLFELDGDTDSGAANEPSAVSSDGGTPASGRASEAGAGADARTRLAPTGRLDRGNSRLLQDLTRPAESYAALRDRVAERAQLIGDLADRGTTAPGPVTTAYARHGDTRC